MEPGQVIAEEHEHEFVVVELRKARRGIDKLLRCASCAAEAVELAQAARRDERPPLGGLAGT